MKLCKRCNLELPENRKFCEFCGSKVSDIDPPVNYLRCPNCNESVEPAWKFCKKCRASLVGAASQPPTFVTQSPPSPIAASAPPPTSRSQPAEESWKIAIRCLSCKQLVDEDSAFCEYCGANMMVGSAPLSHSSVHTVPTTSIKSEYGSSEEVADVEMSASAIAQLAPKEFIVEDAHAAPALEISSEEIVEREVAFHSSVRPFDVQKDAEKDQGEIFFERVPRSEEVRAESSAPMFATREATLSRWLWWHPLVAAAVLVLIIAGLGAGGIYLWLHRSPYAQSTSQPNPNAKRGRVIPSAPEGMVFVRGGSFLMGRDDGDEYERPAHQVTVAPFFLDKFEVTCEQYQKFLDATQRAVPTSWRGGRFPSGAAKLPVTGVTWDDANAYAEWAGKRLPTEEEWEIAARGTSGGKYPWGKEWRAKAANAGDTSAGRLAEVGSYPDGTSSDGLMDLIGNALEWTSSDLTAYPGGQLSSVSRKDIKVIRGGSWKEEKDEATVTYRGYLAPRGAKDYSATGFRCVKESAIASDQE